MMLYADVTRLVEGVDPSEISGSIAERGANAGPETWSNSREAVKDSPILKDEDERRAAREFFRGFGAWSDDEMKAWTIDELDALVLQLAAGDLREIQDLAPGKGLGGINWKKADRLSREGVVSGRVYTQDGRLYVDLSE